MDIKKGYYQTRIHCPECNCMYIVIDNEIVNCPVCELSSTFFKSNVCKGINKEELVQLQF